MVPVAPPKSSTVSVISTLVDLAEVQHLFYHTAGSVSERKWHPQISNIHSAVNVLSGSPQSNTDCLNLVILQDLMNVCCKTGLFKKKMFLILLQMLQGCEFSQKRNCLYSNYCEKILAHGEVFILCLIPQYHSISLKFPTCLLAIYFAASSVKALSLPLLPFSLRLLVTATMKEVCKN